MGSEPAVADRTCEETSRYPETARRTRPHSRASPIEPRRDIERSVPQQMNRSVERARPVSGGGGAVVVRADRANEVEARMAACMRLVR